MSVGTLRFGTRSSSVLALQKQLKQLGHFDGPLTGYYGPITKAAVSSFERAKGLARDGVADPRMRQALATATQGSGSGQQVLRPGMRGPRVKALQQQLRTLGHFPVTPTGYYGSITQRAVRAFERAHGLKVDGTAGQAVQDLAAKLAKKATGTTSGPAWKTAAAPPNDYRRVTYHGARMNVRTREMLQRAEKYAKAMGAPGSFAITQGSYHPGVGASAGTHDGGGALDIRIRGVSGATADRMVKALRMAGFAAWRRGVGDGFSPHIHAIAIGDRQATRIAKSQVAEYFRGGDGLTGSRRDIHLGSTGHNIGRPVPGWATRYA